MPEPEKTDKKDTVDRQLPVASVASVADLSNRSFAQALGVGVVRDHPSDAVDPFDPYPDRLKKDNPFGISDGSQCVGCPKDENLDKDVYKNALKQEAEKKHLNLLDP